MELAAAIGDFLDSMRFRQIDVLGYQQGSLIASELAMSPKTVESHVRSIFTKLDLAENEDENRRVAAVVRWLQSNR